MCMSASGPWLDVDLGALLRNARSYAKAVGVPILPMVKANAYGLGAVPVARALETLDPWGFGVATLGEARQLREAGITRRIMVFVPFVPERLDEYLELDLRPAIGSVRGLDAWMGASDRPFHLEIDTGMGRGGFRWHDEASLAAARDRVHGSARFEGVFMHFAASDSSEALTAEQADRFDAVVGALGRPAVVHLANSAAGQWGARYAGTLARPGIFLYGGEAGSLVPEPVARLQALVHAVRSIRAGDTISYGATHTVAADGEVVTLGIGYADGVHRALSGKGLVAIGDATWTIAGRVTMDMTMVVTPRQTVRVGQVATLFGGPLPLDAQAARAGTISYELLTSVGTRVVRRYGEMP